MNTRNVIPVTVMALLAVAGTSGVALAKDRDQDGRDSLALAAMKVTLIQAITTAERQAGGQAIGADVSQDKGAPQISVEVAGAQGVKTVIVDAQTGQVAATHEGDQDDENSD